MEYIPLLDWNRDSAENGWGADCIDDADETAGGGKGVANNGGGNAEWVDAAECNGGNDVIEPGGGVGLVIVFVAGDNCELLVLQKKTRYKNSLVKLWIYFALKWSKQQKRNSVNNEVCK